MANVISIRIEADGSAAIVGMNGVADSASNMGRKVNDSASTMEASWSSMAKGVAVGNLLTQAFTSATGKIQEMTSASLNYLSTIETANLGIASSYLVGGKYIDETTGRVMTGEKAMQAAMVDAAKTMEQLKVANMQTIATLDQLVRAYQETLPVAQRLFNRDQVMQFTQAMVQAAGAIGLPFDQMGEETRSLLTGNINPRNSRIATVLGLRNEDVAPLMNNGQALFDFLMGKLDGYRIAGVESQKTWAGLWSNWKDIQSQMSGMAFQPLFDTIKSELMDITNHFVTIDDKTKTIRWNDEFLSGIEKVKVGITATIAEVYRLGMLLDKAGGTKTTFDMFGSGIGSALGISRNKHPWLAAIFGSTEEFEEAARANIDYETRYLEKDKKLQKMANMMAGLDENGNPLARKAASRNSYKPNPAKNDAEGDDGYTKSLTQAHETYIRYLKAFDDRVLAGIQASSKLQQDELQARYDRGLVGLQDYLNQRYLLEKAALDKELEQTTNRYNNIMAARDKAEKAKDASATKQNGQTVYDKDKLAAWMKAETDYQNVLKEREGLQNKAAAAAQKLTIDTSNAALDLAKSYDQINIALLEMTGRLEKAAKARIALEWQSPERQRLIADAIAGKPGAEQTYLQQEGIDNFTVDRAGRQERDKRSSINYGMAMNVMNAQGQSYDASRVALLQQLDERQQAIKEAYGNEIELENEKNAALLAAQEEYAAQKTALDKATADKALQTVSGSLTSIGQALMQGNKEQFEAGKAMAIAGATIDTFRAAVGAYAAMASIPYVGPALGAVAAAAAVVSGMAQIAQIESTQYRAGRAIGGPVEAGSTYLVGERGPELLTMGSQGGTVTPNSALVGQRQTVRVTNVYQISTGVSDTVRAEIMRAVPAITAHTVNAVGRAINSGTSLSAAVGRM